MADDDTFDRDARQRTAFVAGAILLMAASFVLVKTGRDALYFQARGLFDLPKAYVAIAIASVPFAFGTLALMRGLGPRRARVVSPLVASLGFGLAATELTAGGGVFNTAVFVAIPLTYGVLFSLAWLLAADLLDGRGSEVLGPAYGRIGAGAIAGGISGGLLAKALARRIPPEALMGLGVGLLGASALVMLVAQIRYPARALTMPARVKDAARRSGSVLSVLKHRYAALLLVVAMAASLTGIFVEFQFYLAASVSHHSGADNASFFAGFYVALNLGALLVQLLVMPRLQRWLGVHGSLLIMPVAILGAGVLMIGNASLLMRSGLKATEGGLKASIHRSNWEQAYLPLSKEQRAAAKLIIDGAAARLAEGLAAAALYVWLVMVVGDGSLEGQSTRWLTYSLIGAAGTWVGLTWVLRRLASGQEGSEELDLRTDLPLPDT
jgi:AAA family ATP:ADP antiporter